MEKVVKDMLSIKDAGKKVGEALKETCPICGSEAYIIGGEIVYMCDCDKLRPVELSNV